MLAAISLLAVAAVSAAPAATLPHPRLEVRIQLEGDTGLSLTDLRVVAEEIRRIWAPVLEVAVRLPSEQSRAGVVDSIRLVITSRTPVGSRALGSIEFVDNEPQPRITVSLTVAERMLREGRWQGTPFASRPPLASQLFLQRALARAAAHEIGHYLLRTQTHTKRGLMRAAFTVDEIMDDGPALNRLESAAVAMLRAGTSFTRRED